MRRIAEEAMIEFHGLLLRCEGPGELDREARVLREKPGDEGEIGLHGRLISFIPADAEL
jgi:hypothetical protein